MENIMYFGLGQVNVTPPLGAELYGYYPHPTAKAVNDELIAFALALGYGDKKVILFSLPVCLVLKELSDRIRAAVSDATGIPAANVILSATHTHSGPKTDSLPHHGELDVEYCDSIFLPRLVEAAKSAVAAMVPAELGIAEGESKVGINRRQINPDHSVSFGQNPWGSYDPTMTVFAFRDAASHKPLATLVHYGCHNTSAGKVETVTRDWCGVMCDRLAKESGAPAMFVNGCEGDVGPRLSNGHTTGINDVSYVYEIGHVAAIDAVTIYRKIKAYAPEKLDLVTGVVRLPYDESRGVSPEGALSFEQTIIRLGETVFIPFPFEFFSLISLRLRAYSGWQRTICLGATNGSFSYLPSRDQLALDGYEVGMFRSGNAYQLAEDTDNRIIDENLRILKGLAK